MSRAVAHPNIALAKYWGKRERAGNFPAVPSLSVTLGAMTTTTTVDFDATLRADELVLGGAQATPDETARAVTVLDRVRAASKVRHHARVVSDNDFPTASGLASSASGFAALAVAAAHAAGLDWTDERVSDLARRGSASAARSVPGGWVELLAGSERGDESEMLGARSIAPRDALDVRVLVCVVSEARKLRSSREGMLLTMARSPFYAPWLELAPRLFTEMKAALAGRDAPKLFDLAEQSSLAMHASAMAAGVVYVRDVTLDLYACVRDMRARGLATFATSDAGPHVKVFVPTNEAKTAHAQLRDVPGVLRVIESSVGEGARVP